VNATVRRLRTVTRHVQTVRSAAHGKAMSAKISGNDDGIVTIEGNVVKDLNIADLINDAMRERKTTKAANRAQFVRLLRSITSLKYSLYTSRE